MNQLMLAQVLGGLFGTARSRHAPGRGSGGFNAGRPGGKLGGSLGRVAMGGVLAGMLRKRAGRIGGTAGHGALVALMLPLVLQWVERNGGVGAVIRRFQDRGYARQTQSWVSTGSNEDIDPQAVEEVMGRGELAQLARQLGVPQEEVQQGIAEILPEMVNQLTPDGRVPAEADQVLHDSIPLLEQELAQARDAAELKAH